MGQTADRVTPTCGPAVRMDATGAAGAPPNRRLWQALHAARNQMLAAHRRLCLSTAPESSGTRRGVHDRLV